MVDDEEVSSPMVVRVVVSLTVVSVMFVVLVTVVVEVDVVSAVLTASAELPSPPLLDVSSAGGRPGTGGKHALIIDANPTHDDHDDSRRLRVMNAIIPIAIWAFQDSLVFDLAPPI